jgi:hypothetical protein
VVEDGETDTAIEGHKWELACEVMVYNSIISVSKCSKQKMLAIDSSSSIAMRLGSRRASYVGPKNTGRASN